VNSNNVQSISNDMDSMKKALRQGYPFVVGVILYPSFFNTDSTGVVPMPSQNDNPIGGHAVVCVGFDDHKQRWIMRNSWGPNWGDNGYFYLPYGYLQNFGQQLYCITNMS
jgi:C1A family cysteine protease